jgi:hypothetical protein
MSSYRPVTWRISRVEPIFDGGTLASSARCRSSVRRVGSAISLDADRHLPECRGRADCVAVGRAAGRGQFGAGRFAERQDRPRRTESSMVPAVTHGGRRWRNPAGQSLADRNQPHGVAARERAVDLRKALRYSYVRTGENPPRPGRTRPRHGDGVRAWSVGRKLCFPSAMKP